MAGLTGLEPATSGVTGRHSNQLSYNPLHGSPCIRVLLVREKREKLPFPSLHLGG